MLLALWVSFVRSPRGAGGKASGAEAEDVIFKKKKGSEEILAIFLKEGRCRLKLTKQKVSGEAARDSLELTVPPGSVDTDQSVGLFLTELIASRVMRLAETTRAAVASDLRLFARFLFCFEGLSCVWFQFVLGNHEGSQVSMSAPRRSI